MALAANGEVRQPVGMARECIPPGCGAQRQYHELACCCPSQVCSGSGSGSGEATTGVQDSVAPTFPSSCHPARRCVVQTRPVNRGGLLLRASKAFWCSNRIRTARPRELEQRHFTEEPPAPTVMKTAVADHEA